MQEIFIQRSLEHPPNISVKLHIELLSEYISCGYVSSFRPQVLEAWEYNMSLQIISSLM